MAAIRVLHLVAADNMLYPLLREQLIDLRERGYEIHTASMPGPLGPRVQEDGFPWTAVPFDRRIAPLKDWKAAKFIANFCHEKKFTIVHTHTPKANVVGQYGARMAKTPLTFETLQGFYLHERMGFIQKQIWTRIERFACKQADHILCHNPEDIETAVRLEIAPREKMTLLGGGINLTRFRPGLFSHEKRAAYRKKLGIPETALVAGICGRFVTEKGYPEFIQASRALLDKHPRLHLLFVGHRLKSERPNLVWNPEAACAAIGIPDSRRTILDNRDDMPELYGVMDLHVLPSHREGFPYVLMEGAASGLPQIATNIRGCRQTVADGQSGFLIQVGDANKLGEYMDLILSDKALWQRMSAAARQKAEREFDQREVFKRVADAYDCMLKLKKLI